MSYVFLWEEIINEHPEAIKPDPWGEDYTFLPTEFQDDSWF